MSWFQREIQLSRFPPGFHLITRQIVEMHGGEIRVASEEGQGATFTCTLPVDKAQ